MPKRRHLRSNVQREQLSLFGQPMTPASRPRQRRLAPVDPPRQNAQRRASLLQLVQRVRAAVDPDGTISRVSDEALVDIALATTRLRIGDIRLTLPFSWRQEPTMTNP